MKAWLTAEEDGVRMHFQKPGSREVASVLLNPREVTDFAIALADKIAELKTGPGMWKVGRAVFRHLFKE